MRYIVALEIVDGVSTQWIASGSGDPARTCIVENARVYNSISQAMYGLARARKYRPFLNAQIQQVKGPIA